MQIFIVSCKKLIKCTRISNGTANYAKKKCWPFAFHESLNENLKESLIYLIWCKHHLQSINLSEKFCRLSRKSWKLFICDLPVKKMLIVSSELWLLFYKVHGMMETEIKSFLNVIHNYSWFTVNWIIVWENVER